jgi:transcription antitermination factor NusG
MKTILLLSLFSVIFCACSPNVHVSDRVKVNAGAYKGCNGIVLTINPDPYLVLTCDGGVTTFPAIIPISYLETI